MTRNLDQDPADLWLEHAALCKPENYRIPAPRLGGSERLKSLPDGF